MKLANNGLLMILASGLLTLGAAQADPVSVLTVGPDNEFGFALTQTIARSELMANPNGNIFISPISTSIALQMLLNGALPGSASYQEMAKTLGVENTDLDSINRANASLLGFLRSSDSAPTPATREGQPPVPFTLRIANSVWSNSNTSFRFAPAFVKTLEQSYQAQATIVDFARPAGAAAINQWASHETGGKITRIIDGTRLENLAFVMMNATYFRASWLKSFDAFSTANGAPFTRGDGTISPVGLMHGRFAGYFGTASMQTMELPYSGGKASMYVVLPKPGFALRDSLFADDGVLTTGFWSQVFHSQKSYAEFAMPKFDLSYEINLNDSLATLGMESIFGALADLSALGTPSPSVGLVKQNSFIHVDENGTEAAAVTAIDGVTSIAPLPPLFSMTVDRPFLIAIVDNTTETVLFLGVISSPAL